MFEVLLILGRAGEPGLPMRAIAQEQVLTTGGATRLVDRMEAAGLVTREESPADRRGKLVRLTPLGEETTVRAAVVHVENIKQHFLEPSPGGRPRAVRGGSSHPQSYGSGRTAPTALTRTPTPPGHPDPNHAYVTHPPHM